MTLPSTHQSLLLAMMDEHRRDAAWFAFDARYRGVIITWCRRHGLQQAGAEDVAQDILLKLFHKLPSYNATKGTFRGWLKAIVNNALIDRRRREANSLEQPGVGTSEFQQWLNNVATPEASEELSDAIASRSETVESELLERVRSRVNEKHWQAFYLTVVEGRKPAVVAEELGLQVGNVYKISYRIKKMVVEEYLNAPPSSNGTGLS